MERAAASGRVLVVEDDPAVCEAIQGVLEAAAHRVLTAGDGAAAMACLEEQTVDTVILDLGLPDIDGIELLNDIVSLDDAPSVVVLTGRDEISTVVEAMRRGAENFLVKPVDAATLTAAVEKAVRQRHLVRHVDVYREAVTARAAAGVIDERELVGSSEAMRKVRELAARVAPTDSSVVLQGESGTGKGVVARLIHRHSQRAAGPFVDLSCAALPPTLVESELFGYEKGAFTDAKTRKPGLLEVAHGGTLFLDEVAELDLTAQSKLLKVLEERCFRRVGGLREVEVDVRLIVATHADLRQRVEEGRFRGDLFYRLNVFRIEMPPLRERGEDILELAYAFIAELNPRMRRRVTRISEAAAQCLLRFSWPGNVRELRNVIERAMILVTGDTLTPAHLPDDIRLARRGRPSGRVATLEEVEAAHIEKVLRQCQGNMKLAAERLGISRSTLYAKLERLGHGVRAAK
ncbi:MAG: sigma-54-dependent Fis family transcriptional regulator [Thermoanaerobaculaceae bacterium]|nr:sigma-54-dependent Fis family transcriptional regulator [Thermoanaerobaculaceae bacterium]